MGPETESRVTAAACSRAQAADRVCGPRPAAAGGQHQTAAPIGGQSVQGEDWYFNY